ncbi:hypothetical protein MHZ92_18380 [Sporosarcina sp. ACRSL]|uniref:hypothetical protein n=1 Tax=Sporosarcina sp. ACRSL TaxID=2918215 RepID=UPI001EF3FFFB|nr:hypothetical protein [Sporosarcina sp. ACRSL]MCG7346083.1 hypothetical protein [Sporosarcina sp. ACRSL]
MNELESLQKIVNRNEGSIISKGYNGRNEKIEFECKEKHRWYTKPTSIFNGHWCPTCNHTVPYTIEDMKRVALERGGQCLSHHYQNAHSKLTWKCAKGHIWQAIPKSIYLHGTWCAECKGVKKLTIEDMKELAERKNGVCLSEEYVNNREKLRWRCEKDHEWESSASNIKSGKWCPRCAKRKVIIEDMEDLAQSRGGNFLSNNYNGKYVKLKWKCKEGHMWESTPATIRSGSWCPVCAKKSTLTISDMDLLAAERGGKCLSINYINSGTLLQFVCKDGHQWETNYRNISKGSWCPSCNDSNGEQKSRYLLEQLLGLEFKKTRKVLKRGLEIDGYNEKLKVGFEFRGIQHYQYVPYFHRTIRGYHELIKRNRDKESQCEQKEIKLLIIPYSVEEESDESLVHFIKSWLTRNSIPFQNKEVSLNSIHNLNSKISLMKEIAESKGGQCLSTVYRNRKHYYEFKCREEHRWTTTFEVLSQGSWCPQCAGNAKLTVEEMKQFAASQGGKCLSNEYINNNTHLLWECNKEHQWKATPSNILRGKWCPTCNKKKRLTINIFTEIANKRGGKCLSSTYINQKTRLAFECQHGHQWDALPNNIQKGKWCPTCKGNRKKTIKDAQLIAQQKQGKCLSTEYVNNKSELQWECSEGHIWTSNYSNIQQGSWCPQCRQL